VAGIRDRVRELAVAALREHPDGLSLRELQALVLRGDGSLQVVQVRDHIQWLATNEPQSLKRVRHGLYALASAPVKSASKGLASESQKGTTREAIREAIKDELADKPRGLNRVEVVDAVLQRLPGVSRQSVAGVLALSSGGKRAFTQRDSDGVYRLGSAPATPQRTKAKELAAVDQKGLIREAIKKELAGKPDGMDGRELVTTIAQRFPTVPRRMVAMVLVGSGLAKQGITQRDSSGVYRLRSAPTGPARPAVAKTGPARSPVAKTEKDFYEPFRCWLEGKPENCRKAIVVGGAPFGLKWSSPDVMGVRRTSGAHKFDLLEIISAEIKLEPRKVVEAFGQACSYRLFSHKSYVVIPVDAAEQEERLDSLCMMFGIGLVVFKSNPRRPEFEIRVRAARGDVDVFELNRILGERLPGGSTIADQLL
jgi:hypothetical protein